MKLHFACLSQFILIFSLFFIDIAHSQEQDWVEPSEEYVATETYRWPGRNVVYFSDFTDAVSSICGYYETALASSINAGYVYKCPVDPPVVTSITPVYKTLNFRIELEFPPTSSRAGQVSWGNTPVVEQKGVMALQCPASHPTAVDTNEDSVIDLCIKEVCSEAKATALEQSLGLKPGTVQVVGNPIQCSTGQKTQVDNVYQGVGKDPLSYSTYYASPKVKDASTQSYWSFNSQLGKQRSDNHDRKLKLIYNQSGGKAYQLSYKGRFSQIFYGLDTASELKSKSAKSGNLTVAANSLTQTKPDGTTYVFDLTGLLTSRVLPDGTTRTYTYTATDKLSTVTNHYGKQLQYFYNANDLLNRLVTPDNREYLFEYDTHENLVKVIYPDDTPNDSLDNPSLTYLFENSQFPNNLTGKIDENGIRLATWSYDANGRAISSEHGLSLEKVELDFSVANETKVTTHVSDTLTNETIYHYSTNYVDGSPKKQLNQLEQSACTDCVVGSWLFEYDNNGFVNQSTSPTGIVTTFVHDDDGFETSRTEAVGMPQQKTITTEWNTTTRKPTSTITGSLKTEFGYNSLHQRTTVTLTDLKEPETRITTFAYGTAGVLDSIDGPIAGTGDLTSFGYDVGGNLHTITNALNQVTTLTNYDANGRVGTITDTNGIVTTLTYTPRGWLETSTTNGALTQYEYYPTGSIKMVTSPSGQTINYEYDDGERLEAIVDTLGNRIEYVRDLMGNVTENNTKDPNGVIKRQQTEVFNALGQLKQSLGNHGQSQTFTYDADGKPLSNKNAKNNTTTTQYDALNRLTKSIDPDNGETTFDYSPNDHLTSVIDAEGKTTSYEYNAFGEVTKLTSPDTGVTTFTYDKAGNVLTKTDARNETVTYTYDALNRVKTQSYSDASENIVYTYDDTNNGNKGIGRLTSVTDQSGSTSYVYNAFGQVTKETRVVDGQTYITEYHFDANGQMTGMTYPSGRQINYTFDGLARVSGMTSTHQTQTDTLASNITYMPFGPMKNVTYGNGKILTQLFDLDYRLTDQSSSGINQMTYGYDLTNNIDTITNGVNTSESQNFTYDKLSRLLSANGEYGSLGFTYDKVGNRLTKTDNANVDTYGYDATSHRLTGITGANPASFTHDAIGNTLTKDGLTFTYNKQGRLSTASKVGMNAAYVYNFQGQRISKQVNGTTTHFVYDLNGQLISEADSTGAIIKEYAYLNGQRHAVIEGGNTYYVHTDHLGTPIALSDDAGVVQWKAHYTPFGKVIIDVNNLTQNIRFPGQYFDSESGLHYNYFRDYDPEIGRYIQSDPIGLNGGINTYGYVGGNPVNYVDPYGLDCVSMNGVTRCAFPGGPTFEVPTPDGFPAELNDSALLYHDYIVSRQLDGTDPNCVRQKLIDNPTPGEPKPATRGGTPNNAVVAGVNNYVTSYLVNDLNTGAQIAVNIAGTGDGSQFGPGYVARYVSNGNAYTVGEGTNWKQSKLTAGPIVQYLGNEIVWGGNMSDLISDCDCQE